MNSQIKQIIIANSSLLVLDLLWIYYFMGDKYNLLVNTIQGSKMKLNTYSAMGAYLLMICVMGNFVIKYKLSYLDTFILGFCLYGVYDLTCGAIFKNWDFNLAFVDMLWGGLVYTVSLYISKQLIERTRF